MLFSTCVRGLIRAADERCGIKVTKKVGNPFSFPVESWINVLIDMPRTDRNLGYR